MTSYGGGSVDAVVLHNAFHVVRGVGFIGDIKAPPPALRVVVALLVAEIESLQTSLVVMAGLLLSLAVLLNAILGVCHGDGLHILFVAAIGLSTLGHVDGKLSFLGKVESPAGLFGATYVRALLEHLGALGVCGASSPLVVAFVLDAVAMACSGHCEGTCDKDQYHEGDHFPHVCRFIMI